MFISSVPTIWWQGFASIYEVRFSCLTADTLKVGCNSSGISSLSAIEWPGWLKCSKKALKHTYQLRAMAMPCRISHKRGETAVHGCHCPGDMVVRMRRVSAIPRIWYVCFTTFFALIKVGRDCCCGVCVEWIVCCLSMFSNWKRSRSVRQVSPIYCFLHLLHWIIYVRFVESDK